MPNVSKDTTVSEKRTCFHLLRQRNLTISGDLCVKENKLEPGVLKAVDLITQNFPVYSDVKYLGNNHNVCGDISLLIGNREVFIELKFPCKGFTTLGNMGLWLLTWMTNDSIESFNEFVKRSFQKKLKIVGLSPTATNAKFIERCRQIRISSKVEHFAETEEGKQIKEIDDKDKTDYMSLVIKNLRSKKDIANLCSLLTNGIHKKKELVSLLNAKTRQREEYHLLNINHSDDSKNVFGTLIDMTNKPINILSINLIDSAKALEIKTDDKPFEFRLHWKNVGQGVATPCVMVW